MKAYHAWNKSGEMAELTQCSMDHQNCDDYSRYYDMEEVDAEIARLKADKEFLRSGLRTYEDGFERDRKIIAKLREQNAKLQAALRDMLRCNFTIEKCAECYEKACLVLSNSDTAENAVDQ